MVDLSGRMRRKKDKIYVFEKVKFYEYKKISSVILVIGLPISSSFFFPDSLVVPWPAKVPREEQAPLCNCKPMLWSLSLKP